MISGKGIATLLFKYKVVIQLQISYKFSLQGCQKISLFIGGKGRVSDLTPVLIF